MLSPIDVATGYLQSFTGNDPDAIASFVSEGFRSEHQSELGSGCTGRQEYRRRLPHFLSQFADRSYIINDIVHYKRESETDVVVKYRFVGIFTENDARVEIPGVMWFGIRDGEITRRTDTWDSLTFMRQIGAD